MTKEEKELLLVDLCARLPYGVKVAEFDDNGRKTSMAATLQWIEVSDDNTYKNLKPYLRPMSSMTEEEQREYHKTFRVEAYGNGYVYVESVHSFDWLNKHNFAYRTIYGKDMFELGLALEAPEGMYGKEEEK